MAGKCHNRNSCSARNQLLNHRISAGEQRKAHSAAERFGVPHFLATTISPHEKYQTSVPEWDRQFRVVRVHHEYREELGRFRLAGIGANAVAVAVFRFNFRYSPNTRESLSPSA